MGEKSKHIAVKTKKTKKKFIAHMWNKNERGGKSPLMTEA